MADHAEWIGPMQTLYDPEGAVVGEMPAVYIQVRAEDGSVKSIPAGDMDETTYAALSVAEKAAVVASGLYTVIP